MTEKFFGKYRGTVVNNIDPLSKGRLQVSVPAVYGSNTLNWALPCLPYAGDGVGFLFLPVPGTNIWVEFEAGDISYPIWSGCFWGDGQGIPGLPQTLVLKTPSGTLSFDPLNPMAPVRVEIEGGSKLALSASGVKIETSAGATVELVGPMVKINGDALQVT